MPAQPFVSRARRILLRSSAAAVLASGLIVGASPGAHAATTDLVCTGGGQIDIHSTSDGTYDWLLSGIGQCELPKVAQVQQVTLVGKATTQGLGLCSNAPVIPAFNMSVAATFVHLDPTRGAVSTLQAQFWQIPLTTFPIVSEFAITDVNGNAIGAGELETHIFAQCPPGGQPTMQVNWTQTA